MPEESAFPIAGVCCVCQSRTEKLCSLHASGCFELEKETQEIQLWAKLPYKHAHTHTHN